MTPEILEYLLRLTVIWAVLIAYYFLALRRAGFAAQRFYLLGALAFGLVVPLLPALGGGLPVVGLPSVTYVAEPYFYTGEGAAEVAVSSWSWSAILPWLYLAGVAFFGARTLVQWNGLRAWASSGESDRYDGYRVIRHQAVTGPFVAFGIIFLPEEMPDADLENTALIHEASHLRARHHYDTLLLTLGSLLLWFHPLFWILRRLLATVHEYEADAAVIRTVPVRTYGLQLLQSSLGPAGFPGLFSSPIKKRITMITTKNRARKLRLLPLLVLSLLLAGLVVACSDVGEDVAIPLNNESPFGEMKADPFEYMEEPEVWEEEPEKGDVVLVGTPNTQLFADGKLDRMIREIYKHITYPKIARQAGITGKLHMLLYINESGVVEWVSQNSQTENAAAEVTIVGIGTPSGKSDPHPVILTDEIVRAMNGKRLPDRFRQNDAPVALMLAIDFNFILEE